MLKVIRQASVGFIILVSAITLSACGSSSGSEPKAKASNLKPGVFFIGRIFSDGSRKEGTSLLSSTGKFVATLDRNSFTFVTLTFSGSGQFSGPVVEYILGDSWERTNATLSGEVTTSNEATLTASRTGLSSNGIIFRNDKLSDSGVTFEDLSAVYTVINSASVVTIGPTGEVTGGDRGCVFNGQVVIPDKAINVFELTYEASNCSPLPTEGAAATDRDGKFTGLGTHDPSRGEIVFYARNGTVAWMFKGTR